MNVLARMSTRASWYGGILWASIAYVLYHFHGSMDGYEQGILLIAGVILTALGYRWQRFAYFSVGVVLASLYAISLYHGALPSAQSGFMLRFLLSSQSALMWMNVLFILALLLYWLSLWRDDWGGLASGLTWFAVGMGVLGLLTRWYESYLIAPEVGHIPLSNLYEVFILFCLITALLYLYAEERLKTHTLGGIVLLVINAAVGFILWYTLSRHAYEIQPLVPALQSYWMKIHVPANFIGYGSFSFSAMVACAYLLAKRGILSDKLPSLTVLDDLMYRAISLGFIFFTLATFLGAVWAAEAWGGYWSWDPKETWALIVWLNYAAWLHWRLVKGWRGASLAWWALLGLLITSFAFLGVNLFLSGLHSYGTL